MPTLTFVVLLTIALLTSGCATVRNYPTRSVNTMAEVKTLNDSFTLGGYILLHAQPENQRIYRNDLINARILSIDLYFEKFQQDLVRDNALTDLGAEWATMALSGASAVVPLAQTKTVLSAIATGLEGAKGSVDKNIFYKKTIVALISQMKADRQTVLLNIQNKMDLGTDIYPLTAALIDLEEYFKSGSIPQALTSITATAGATIKVTKEKIQGKYVKDNAGDLIQKYWKPDGVNVNEANQAKLLEWMGNNGIVKKVRNIAPLISYSEYSAKRTKAVKDLNLE